jgi:ABC-type branched-subunit amino acid transport system permease subunit
MGLVLTYKTSGLFNFAHGAVSAVSAYVFYSLREEHGVSWPIAAVLTVLVFGTIVAALFERIAGGLAGVSITYRIVATVGVIVAVLASVQIIFGPESLVFHRFLGSEAAFTVKGVQVSHDDLVDVGVGVIAAIALSVFFRISRLGTEMRAVVDDSSLLGLTGTSPTRVRLAAWWIGSMFASLSGVLFASAQQQLEVGVLSLLVVQAFGAAAVGRFTSIPLAYLGGIAVGLAQSMTSKLVGEYPSLGGLDTNMPFLVLIVLLLVTPKNRLVEVGRQVKNVAVPGSRFSGPTRMAGYAVLLGGAIAVPWVVGGKLPIWNTAVTQVVLFASLSLLVRTSGQISLCHIGFAAVGAAGFAHMLAHGVPWFPAVLIGGMIALPVGAIVAIPSFRLSGLYLGLVTLGFGILLNQYAYTKGYFFAGQIATDRPHGWGLDGEKSFYYLLLAIAVASVVAVVMIERSRLGRILRGLSDSPVALTTLGTNVNLARFVVFCISAFLAGISGATYASLFGAVNQASFPYTQSLIVLTVLVIAGRRTVMAAVVAPALLYLPPGYISDANTVLGLQVGFGVAAVLVALTSQRGAAVSSAAEPDAAPGGGGRAALHRSTGPLNANARRRAARPADPAPDRELVGSHGRS